MLISKNTAVLLGKTLFIKNSLPSNKRQTGQRRNSGCIRAAIAAVFAPQCVVVTMSYEPRRTKAYDGDLRWRMVYQVKVLPYNFGRVSANLGVSHSTVRRMVRLFDTMGNVDGRGYGSHLVWYLASRATMSLEPSFTKSKLSLVSSAHSNSRTCSPT